MILVTEDETTSEVTQEPAQPEPQPQARQDDTEWQRERNTRVVTRAKDNPEVLNDLLSKIDAATGAITAMELKLATSEAMRQYGLTDDDRELIEAATPEGIHAKAAKLAARNAAQAEAHTPPKEPEIVYPQSTFTPKNEWEAAQETLRRFK